MIIINNTEYKNNEVKITENNYEVTQDNKKRNGIAPFIQFKCENTLIGIETNYDKKMIEEMNENMPTDITRYITDITYEDEKGWVSLINGDYDAILEKKENTIFNIKFNCVAEECDEKFNIKIDENINI